MKLTISILLALLPVACSSPPIQSPTATRLPPKAATLIAAGPSLEVTFDGHTCAISGETPLSVGKQVFLLHNDSSQRSFLWAGRLYGDKRWADFLQWFQDHCGTPGSICDRTGEAPWISWLFESASADVGSDERYFEFDLHEEGEYFLLASWLDGSVWPCGPYQVGPSE
jgi:hypothetical protein